MKATGEYAQRPDHVEKARQSKRYRHWRKYQSKEDECDEDVNMEGDDDGDVVYVLGDEENASDEEDSAGLMKIYFEASMVGC